VPYTGLTDQVSLGRVGDPESGVAHLPTEPPSTRPPVPVGPGFDPARYAALPISPWGSRTNFLAAPLSNSA
jgi:hypothetical protein